MTVGEITGVLALLVSLGNTAWNIYSARSKQRASVEFLREPDWTSAPGRSGDSHLPVTLVNRGEHPIRVRRVWLEHAADDFMGFFVPIDNLPADLGPHEAATFYLSLSALEEQGLDTTEPYSVIAKLATGELFTSDPQKAPKLKPADLARLSESTKRFIAAARHRDSLSENPKEDGAHALPENDGQIRPRPPEHSP